MASPRGRRRCGEGRVESEHGGSVSRPLLFLELQQIPASSSLAAVAPPLMQLHRGPQEDGEQCALLRSRIEEQSHLISILKRRADDTLARCQVLECRSGELERARDVADKRCSLLEQRFMELASNHQEMITFKDEHKKQNMDLREENAQLRRENEDLFSASIEERDTIITKLAQDLQALQTECSEQEQLCSQKAKNYYKKENEFKIRLEYVEKTHAQETESLKKKLKELETKIAETEALTLAEKSGWAAEQKSLKKQVDDLAREKQELLELTMQRGRLLQERQKDIQLLEHKLRKSEDARRSAEERFERDVEAVNAELQVRALRGKLDNSAQAFDRLQKEFEAFKKHSGELLSKEKQLNAKLRHFVS
ncbi:coiled-coil domain-containing protein 89 isoform X2 [Lampetra fluviatilis]